MTGQNPSSSKALARNVMTRLAKKKAEENPANPA